MKIKEFGLILRKGFFVFHNESALLEAERILMILERMEAKSSSVHGKILEMLFIQHVIKSKQIFLGQLVDVDTGVCFDKACPISFEKSKNTLYFPSSETYPVFDAVLVHHSNEKSKVSFIQITRIQKPYTI